MPWPTVVNRKLEAVDDKTLIFCGPDVDCIGSKMALNPLRMSTVICLLPSVLNWFSKITSRMKNSSNLSQTLQVTWFINSGLSILATVFKTCTEHLEHAITFWTGIFSVWIQGLESKPSNLLFCNICSVTLPRKICDRASIWTKSPT